MFRKHTTGLPIVGSYGGFKQECLYSTPAIALDALSAIYGELRLNLERYANQQGSATSYVDRQNYLLFRLTQAIDALQAVATESVWQTVQKEVNGMLCVDPLIDAVVVIVSFCPNPQRVGHLPIDYYAS